jgi:glycosyltransferase involved in cell wall biosynthesis
MEHPEEARRMGENGRRAVLERYNWGEMERRLLEVYQAISGNISA